MIDDLPYKESVEPNYESFLSYWNKYKGKKNRLRKALYDANKKDIYIITFLIVIFSFCMFIGPVLVIFIIDYIDDPEVNYITIVWILSTLFISKYISSLLTQLVYFKCQVVG